MASFCSKCGAELSADTRFCQGCGAPTGFTAVPAPTVPAGQVAVAPAPAVTAPSSGTLKVVLIIVGAIVCLGMLSAVAVMFGLWRISKSVHVDRAGGMTITTPAGKFSSGRTSAAHLSESEVGAPIYPGAVAEEGGFKIGRRQRLHGHLRLQNFRFSSAGSGLLPRQVRTQDQRDRNSARRHCDRRQE